MFDVKSVNETLQIIEYNFSGYQLEEEIVDIRNAVARVTVRDLNASEDIPGFNRSSVDGYAVISSDTFGASESLPAQLQLIGTVKMGEKPLFALKAGQAAYVPTGGELPENADAVVMIEYTENFNDGFIYINKSSSPGNHLVFRGDDVRKDDVVVKEGTWLRPQDVGILAAMGYSSVPVKRKIRVGIISSGDEIVDVGVQPTGSQVRDVNSYVLHSALKEWGVEPELFGIVKDDFESIKQAIEKLLMHSDIVLISGGSSVGTKDETYKVIDSLGEPGVIVHGIAVKPGKPTILGKIGNKAVVGLPGHPASAYIIFKIFVGYLINVINDEKKALKSGIRAEMAYNYPSNNGREEFLPVKLEESDGKWYAYPVFGKSGLISMLASASGYVHISRGSEGVDKGAEVDVVLF